MTTETTITIPVTPKLLRRIADEMELHMKSAKLGDWVYEHRFHKGQELTVKLQADQGAFHKRGQSDWA